MNIFVGSTNPAKIKAVRKAIAASYDDANIISVSVKSGIAEQPTSDEETRLGAFNRATAAIKKGLSTHDLSSTETVLGVGLEGGVYPDDKNELWSTVWVCVVTPEGQRFESNGARLKLPEIIAQALQAGGEMGPVVDDLLQKAGRDSVRHNHGMIGVITNNFTDRIEEYASIARVAFGLWHGRNWHDDLRKKLK